MLSIYPDQLFCTLYWKSGFPSGKAFLEGSFHVVSIITTTGFYTGDYNLWGNLMIMILFILMFTGGTSGSTSGGIKIVRLLLITKNSQTGIEKVNSSECVSPCSSR